MMITLRKLPLAVAVAAGVMSAQAMAVDFTAMHVPVLVGQVAAVNNSVSRLPVLKVNTVLATNVKLMLN